MTHLPNNTSLKAEVTKRLINSPIGLIGKRLLSRNYVLVTGCQRSGTTLTLLMLDAHSRIRGCDESEVHLEHPRQRELLNDLRAGRYTCHKLPTKTGELDTIKRYMPNAHIIWLIRHPLSVVSSMRRLRLPGWRDNWLRMFGAREMERLAQLFPDIDADEVDAMTEVQLGAHVWARKCQALEAFRAAGLNVVAVRYEDLLAQPEVTMRDVLDFLSLKWEDRILLYHDQARNKVRTLAGGTRGAKELDQSRRDPDVELGESEIQLINDICRPWMLEHGYESDRVR